MSGFRTAFGAATKRIDLNWFPKHMNSGLKQMQAKLRSVDCVLEVHDARIPLSGRNPNLCEQLVGPKPHILILNKADLITNDMKGKIRRIYGNGTPCMKNIIFTNCKYDQCSGIRKIIPKMKELIETSDRFHRSHTKEYHAMIIGIPNSGKSSLINMLRSKNLRKGRAVKVGPSAGVTKCVHEKVRICENPPIFLFDTPGILQPVIPNATTGMKLAVCGNLPDSKVGELVIADYILFVLNKMEIFSYTDFMGLKEPSDCITTVLTSGAAHHNYVQSLLSSVNNQYILKPDMQRMSSEFILAFRRGQFGKITLDRVDSIFEEECRHLPPPIRTPPVLPVEFQSVL